MVVEAHTIISKHAMMTHLEHAAVTDRAVVGSGWLEVVTLRAFSIPEALKISHGFGSVLHQSFDIFLEALIPIILSYSFCAAFPGLFDLDLCLLAALSVFELLSELLVLDEVARTAWLDDHGPKVVEHDVVDQREPYGYPYQPEEDTESFLDDDANHGEICVNVKAEHHVNCQAKYLADSLHGKTI